ncbi:hypothetical protein DFA_11201 [Cavenderia fasciculata]|uniref:Uncharacterized protein n=1 Tax=Cavenderia fasciculata TaxID=261658 RepID=F4QFD3_CACFS|nr:uncharacterized protein DFA_11201 [Cavenderia fasciculata]EGG13440.1 hypothetical protein DFA_11201 [Cavenderia fasciculata]|eukprot:XP_004350144.1 hypothetical protein DFA_11201 [Cavenderia fasciculata]
MSFKYQDGIGNLAPNFPIPPTSTPDNVTIDEKKKKKKKDKKKRSSSLSAPYFEPGEFVKGLPDEKDYVYNYDNVIDVQVDTEKQWTEATLANYLKDAGFVRGSLDGYQYKKSRSNIIPLFIHFTNKILFQAGKHHNNGVFQVGGENSKVVREEFVEAFSFIGSDVLGKMGTRLPPPYCMMATLLVVAGYTMGFPNYCQGRLADTIKHTLVKFNLEIPRNHQDLAIKTQYHYNRYFSMVDKQRMVEWDKSNLTNYLKYNLIGQYSTTRYPPTEENYERIIAMSKMIMIEVFFNNYNNEDKPVDDTDSVEVVLCKMGHMVYKYWAKQDEWAHDMRIRVLVVTLLAFQTGLVNYFFPPLIPDYIKSVVLDY